LPEQVQAHFLQHGRVMALKITLKPNERIVLGGAVIQNGPFKAEFTIENTIPILRQKYILSPEEANTPAKRIYFAVQLMYVDEAHLAEHHKLYWTLVRDFVSALPRAVGLIDQISELILQGQYYGALKAARKLIQLEQEVLDRV
jgi:flagellar biosynthesis repressor protein FlbT